MTTTLVLGGVRSGKSRLAENMLITRSAVTYVATGKRASDGDAEWRDRVRAHIARRPTSWSTLETTDLTRAIMGARTPLLIDDLSSWVTAIVDRANAWDDYPRAVGEVERHLEELMVLWTVTKIDIVAVSNEVGGGVVPSSQSGRVFRDVMGIVNTRIGGASDQLFLCIAGRKVDLSQCPIV